MIPIDGYPGYFVDDLKIWSARACRHLTPHISCPNGYWRVGMLDPLGKQRMVMVHRLLAMAHIPNPEGLPFINHKDGCKLNNSLENLAWIDTKGNAIHAYKIGLHVPLKGSRKPTALLKEQDIAFIRNACATRSISQAQLARMFGVHRSTILNVHLRKVWNHV